MFFDKESKECKEADKDCGDFYNEKSCNNYYSSKLYEASQKCIFKNGVCKRVYINCDIYNTKFVSANRNEEDCEAILPYEDSGNYYKCIYEESSYQKHKIEKCEDYDGDNRNICTSISTENDSLYKCVLNGNKCTKHYKDCYVYGEQDNITK